MTFFQCFLRCSNGYTRRFFIGSNQNSPKNSSGFLSGAHSEFFQEMFKNFFGNPSKKVFLLRSVRLLVKLFFGFISDLSSSEILPVTVPGILEKVPSSIFSSFSQRYLPEIFQVCMGFLASRESFQIYIPEIFN